MKCPICDNEMEDIFFEYLCGYHGKFVLRDHHTLEQSTETTVDHYNFDEFSLEHIGHKSYIRDIDGYWKLREI